MHMLDRTRRSVAALVVTTVVTAVTLLTSPATADPTTPTHGPHQNGCTFSPDSAHFPVYYNFHRACDLHDLCYHHHYYGDGAVGQKACDVVFHGRMRGWCVGHYDDWWERPKRYACYGVAATYYGAVRNFGWMRF